MELYCTPKVNTQLLITTLRTRVQPLRVLYLRVPELNSSELFKLSRTTALERFSNHTEPISVEHVSMEINYCLFTLFHDNEARLSSIVAYLRKRNVVLSHCYNIANVIEPREPHTCNNNNANNNNNTN
jgi:hypothetical protein